MRRIALASLFVLVGWLGLLPSAAGGSTPSGEPVSVAPAGYRTVFTDNFDGSSLGPHWRAYKAQPGSDPADWWDPSHVVVGNGMLELKTYQDPRHWRGPSARIPWVSGGISSTAPQTYGEYLVRSRVTSATGVTQVELLWPAYNRGPPEIDFNESTGANGESFGTLHWNSRGTVEQEEAKVAVDLTHWHTWGLIWSHDRTTYTLDGRTWAVMTNPHTSTVPMVLDIQQQVWNPTGWEHGPTTATPVETDLQVDWVAQYVPVGGDGVVPGVEAPETRWALDLPVVAGLVLAGYVLVRRRRKAVSRSLW